MEIISKTEEMILLAIWRLQGNAYGVTIREYLINKTGKNFSIGGIYVPLERLERKGYVKSFQGNPTKERGGMSKRFYNITPKGNKILNEAKEINEKLWAEVQTL